MFVAVEGSLAAGKSSLLGYLAEAFSVPVFQEPVTAWAPLLQRFYEGGESAFGVQMKIMADIAVGQGDAQGDGVYERCAWTQPWTFNKVLHGEGLLTCEQLDLLRRANGMLARRPDVIVYLRCEPRVAMERLVRRGRACEANVTLDYMMRMHEAYEDMAREVGEAGRVAVHTVDVTRLDPGEVKSTVGYYLSTALGLPLAKRTIKQSAER